MKFLFPFVFLVFIMVACDEERVQFAEPQPSGVEPDKEVRRKLIGDYFSEEDSNYLHITSNKIWVSTLKESKLEGTLSKDLKGSIQLGSDSVVSLGVKVKSKNKNGDPDSVALEASFEEILLDLSKNDELRHFKGYYFLNQPVNEGSGYLVRILRPTKVGILLCRIQSDSVLQLLENEEFVKRKENEDAQEDSWILEPSRKELKKLINMGLFSKIKFYKELK